MPYMVIAPKFQAKLQLDPFSFTIPAINKNMPLVFQSIAQDTDSALGQILHARKAK